jgi:hypothetical protein
VHIDYTYLTNRTSGQSERPSTAPDAAKVAAGAPRSPAISTHVPSAELLALLERVSQSPEVRADVLQGVVRRLASGFYLTREAALQTAEAIQKAQE